MEVMTETCFGIDVHQKSIICCILDGPLGSNKPKKFRKNLVQQLQLSKIPQLGYWKITPYMSFSKALANIGCCSLIYSQIQNSI